MNPPLPPQRTFTDRLALIGGLLTGIYLAGWGWYAIRDWGAFAVMKPNEWGDFLAGTFGPVAFLWLVLGYLQQGQELRLQAQELAKSVEQHKELVKASREQVDITRSALEHEIASEREAVKPRFDLDYAEMNTLGVTMIGIIFTCRVAPASSVEVLINSIPWKFPSKKPDFPVGGKVVRPIAKINCRYSEWVRHTDWIVSGLSRRLRIES